MKICVISPVVIPILGNKQRYGGIEYVVGLVSDELVKRGHEVYLFASGDSTTKAKLIPTTPRAIGQGSSFGANKKANKDAYERSIELKPDVIWDHTTAFHALDMSQDKSNFHYEARIELDEDNLINTGDIPVVHTLHGPAKYHLPEIVRKLSHGGHYFASISKDQGKSFAPFIKNKIQHLGTAYNAIDLKYHKPYYGKRKDYLLWVGRFSIEKGAHIAIMVARKLRKPIYLAGKVTEKHEKRYFNKFIKNNMRPEDRFFNLPTNEEKLELLQKACLTLMPNLWPEPFGLVAVESMASGTPVAGPNYGSLGEVIGDGGYLVNIKDLGIDDGREDITSPQIEYARRLSEKIRKSADLEPSEIRQRTERLFSVQKTAEKYEVAFKKAIQLKRGK